MKKILINGCSFTAGDALTWKNYHPDIDWMKYVFHRKLHPVYSSKQIQQYYTDYKDTLRKKDNVGGQLSKLLNVEVIDIAEDGSSNDILTLKTISFLEKLSPEERKNYHVCVGWTELTRRMVWLPDLNDFFSLHHSHLNQPTFRDRNEFIKEVIISAPDEDHYVNFFSNVFFLQCYLKLNNISYTFWRTLGGPSPAAGRYNEQNIVKNMHLQHDKIFDNADWLSFDKYNQPWIGDVWWNVLTQHKHFISVENPHPSLDGVIQLSTRLADKIRPLVQ